MEKALRKDTLYNHLFQAETNTPYIAPDFGCKILIAVDVEIYSEIAQTHLYIL